MKTSITFYTFCLFISFLVFLHFYICNVRFVSANNKFLIFIYIIIIILKFIITFLPVNIGKFCKQIFNFYCKWYVWKQPFSVFSLKYSFALGIAGEIPWGGSFPVKLPVLCLLFWWKWVPSRVFFKYFAYFIIFYCVNGCFGGTNPGGHLII